MRVYIIANDGITLSRGAPAAITEGEIAVASKEELHAAPLSGKRLLALWNALPSVEKRKKVGDRAALVDQLWAAVKVLPEPEALSDAKRPSKQGEVIAMLRRPERATVDEVSSSGRSTAKRIGDKIAASKKKGMWMGGNIPLGYGADERHARHQSCRGR